MNEELSTQDVTLGAEPSAASTVQPEVTAPAGDTAAPALNVQEKATPTFDDRIPKERFFEVVNQRRQLEAKYKEVERERSEWAKREADYKAAIERAQAEPPPWAQKMWGPKEEPVPDFGGDPALEKAYHLEKAIAERDARIEALSKRFEDLEGSHKTFQQKLQEERELAQFQAKLEADFRAEAARIPGLEAHQEIVYGFIAEGRARNVPDAVALYRAFYSPAPTSVPTAPAVRAASTPPVATAAAPARVPGPVRSSPASLQPAEPEPTSFNELVARGMRRYA